MAKKNKTDWFAAGLQILEIDGFSKITIDSLCTSLQVTKGSFYHHFGNIDGYIESLMKYWIECYTLAFIRKAEEVEEINERSETLNQMAFKAPHKGEQMIRAWSYSNNIVKKYVLEVDTIRIDYLINIRIEKGEESTTARHAAMLEYAVLIGLQQLYPNLSEEERTAMYQLYSYKPTL